MTALPLVLQVAGVVVALWMLLYVGVPVYYWLFRRWSKPDGWQSRYGQIKDWGKR